MFAAVERAEREWHPCRADLPSDDRARNLGVKTKLQRLGVVVMKS